MRNNFVENYEKMSDDELIKLINGGRYELLQIIIKRYLHVINYYADRLCPASEREDIVQDASFALYSAVKNYNPEKSSFSTFASLCIKRCVIQNLKNISVQKKIPEQLLSPIDDVELTDGNSPEKIFFDKENLQALTDNIRLELSDKEYNVLRLFLAGDKYSDIADKLGITVKSVDNSLKRIRNKLNRLKQ